MRAIIERFPGATILSSLLGAGASKGAALRTANEIADMAYTGLGIVFLLLSISVMIKTQILNKPKKLDE